MQLLAAFAVCVPPAAVTYFVTTRLGKRVPLLVAPLALLGIGVRGLAAVVGVVVASRLLPDRGYAADGLPEWVAAVYVATLTVETALLVRWVRRHSPGAT